VLTVFVVGGTTGISVMVIFLESIALIATLLARETKHEDLQ